MIDPRQQTIDDNLMLCLKRIHKLIRQFKGRDEEVARDLGSAFCSAVLAFFEICQVDSQGMPIDVFFDRLEALPDSEFSKWIEAQRCQRELIFPLDPAKSPRR